MVPEECREDNCNSGYDQESWLRSQHSRKALLMFFGQYNEGKPVLDVIVRISMMTLTSYPGEKDLQVENTEQCILKFEFYLAFAPFILCVSFVMTAYACDF